MTKRYRTKQQSKSPRKANKAKATRPRTAKKAPTAPTSDSEKFYHELYSARTGLYLTALADPTTQTPSHWAAMRGDWSAVHPNNIHTVNALGQTPLEAARAYLEVLTIAAKHSNETRAKALTETITTLQGALPHLAELDWQHTLAGRLGAVLSTARGLLLRIPELPGAVLRYGEAGTELVGQATGTVTRLGSSGVRLVSDATTGVASLGRATGSRGAQAAWAWMATCCLRSRERLEAIARSTVTTGGQAWDALNARAGESIAALGFSDAQGHTPLATAELAGLRVAAAPPADKAAAEATEHRVAAAPPADKAAAEATEHRVAAAPPADKAAAEPAESPIAGASLTDKAVAEPTEPRAAAAPPADKAAAEATEHRVAAAPPADKAAAEATEHRVAAAPPADKAAAEATEHRVAAAPPADKAAAEATEHRVAAASQAGWEYSGAAGEAASARVASEHSSPHATRDEESATTTSVGAHVRAESSTSASTAQGLDSPAGSGALPSLRPGPSKPKLQLELAMPALAMSPPTRQDWLAVKFFMKAFNRTGCMAYLCGAGLSLPGEASEVHLIVTAREFKGHREAVYKRVLASGILATAPTDSMATRGVVDTRFAGASGRSVRVFIQCTGTPADYLTAVVLNVDAVLESRKGTRTYLNEEVKRSIEEGRLTLINPEQATTMYQIYYGQVASGRGATAAFANPTEKNTHGALCHILTQTVRFLESHKRDTLETTLSLIDPNLLNLIGSLYNLEATLNATGGRITPHIHHYLESLSTTNRAFSDAAQAAYHANRAPAQPTVMPSLPFAAAATTAAPTAGAATSDDSHSDAAQAGTASLMT